MDKHFEKHASLKRRIIRPGQGLLLSVPELARTLGESEKTIRSWSNANIIPTVDCGFRTKRFSLDQVMSALKRRTIRAK
jgi:hypothetical protein